MKIGCGRWRRAWLSARERALTNSVGVPLGRLRGYAYILDKFTIREIYGRALEYEGKKKKKTRV